jgi:hypothetical protein
MIVCCRLYGTSFEVCFFHEVIQSFFELKSLFLSALTKLVDFENIFRSSTFRILTWKRSVELVCFVHTSFLFFLYFLPT